MSRVAKPVKKPVASRSAAPRKIIRSLSQLGAKLASVAPSPIMYTAPRRGGGAFRTAAGGVSYMAGDISPIMCTVPKSGPGSSADRTAASQFAGDISPARGPKPIASVKSRTAPKYAKKKAPTYEFTIQLALPLTRKGGRK